MAIQLNPGLAMGYYARGNVYIERNDNDCAIADYTEAIRLDHQFAMAYYNRGNAYSNKRDYDRAIADYTEAIRLDPQNAFAYYNRGNAYSDKMDYDRAIADYTEAIRLNPQYAMAYYNCGLAYIYKGDYDRALPDLETALRINPNVPNARNNLAIVQRALQAQQANFIIIPNNIIPNNFNAADYTRIDLSRAVSNSRNLQTASSRQDALRLGGTHVLQYVSDLTFVRQDGTTITFSSDDNAITQTMTIDQRSGLQAGQKVRVYYMITRTSGTTWDVIAIEWR
jgi:tetratricopeptide (TPR) repeat protein